MSLDLSAIEASLNEVEKKESSLQEQSSHQLPPSPLIGQTDELLLELDLKQTDPKLDHKFKCKKCKKPEKSKGYFEKQNFKQKQIKKLKKNSK
ncbi:hypothetical protein M9Y10_011677 [Tritrichomonas musculus]|uniref:Uncharacterized protein n=1 Tax=Tritrichomonas musculus TaxID=1915356 RepID=A0ABR2ILD0_9EUKA